MAAHPKDVSNTAAPFSYLPPPKKHTSSVFPFLCPSLLCSPQPHHHPQAFVFHLLCTVPLQPLWWWSGSTLLHTIHNSQKEHCITTMLVLVVAFRIGVLGIDRAHQDVALEYTILKVFSKNMQSILASALNGCRFGPRDRNSGHIVHHLRQCRLTFSFLLGNDFFRSQCSCKSLMLQHGVPASVMESWKQPWSSTSSSLTILPGIWWAYYCPDFWGHYL